MMKCSLTDVDIIYITTPHNTHYGFIRSIL